MNSVTERGGENTASNRIGTSRTPNTANTLAPTNASRLEKFLGAIVRRSTIIHLVGLILFAPPAWSA